MARTRLRVTGTVQGVGFRPFVYRTAVALGLAGSVRNDSAGVLIEVEGDPDSIAELTRRLTADAPPLARVTGVVPVAATADAPSGERWSGFTIVPSDEGGVADAPVSVDTAACADCLAEVDDPRDRRFRYPFTNCTNCGPRYTIVRSVPYDRPATTMATFAMCGACTAEYHDPADRRFHAQPNACAECGPRLTWRRTDGSESAEGELALAAAVAALGRGEIVAVKGIGGFHLAVDATSPSAIGELRRRKARDDKPFAVMVADLAGAHDLCVLDERAVEAITSPRRPIVLAARRPAAGVADAVAPGLPELGLLLPYSPLHHLLLAALARPLVMTSGNRSDEPIAHDDGDAAERLGPLVDGLLGNDRPIHIRCDDSVARATPRRIQLLRRSRGYAPEPVALPFSTRRAVLALGAELKSTIAVAKGSMLVASHHIGDLEHLATYRSFLQAIDHLPQLYGVAPDLVAHDMHPEYLSTKVADELDVETMAIQHHHAHVAACLAEHGHTGRVLGVAYDGLGFGCDGALWGGEFLVADLATSERVGHLRAVPLPGGAAAIREPWRMGAVWGQLAAGNAAVDAAFGDVDPATLAAVLDLAGRATVATTSSVGRLFDAVAALLGGRRRVTYEAQAAIELEALARTVPTGVAPRYDGTVAVIAGDDGLAVLDPAALVAALLDDHRRGTPVPTVAAGFHESFGRATAATAIALAQRNGLDTVVLTGGVFQNSYFSEVVEAALEAEGLLVLVHGAVPPNDGGISIGQAAVAAYTTT